VAGFEERSQREAAVRERGESEAGEQLSGGGIDGGTGRAGVDVGGRGLEIGERRVTIYLREPVYLG
jgi:hypothetical protein